MSFRFTEEQIRDLAAIDRAMDAGTQPFVRDIRGNRWAASQTTLDAIGAVSGQTASDPLIYEMLLVAQAECLAQIALADAKSKASGQ